MSKLAVTVVIPVYNMADRLDGTIPNWGAELEKTGRAYEILIVDDGSADTTAETVAKLKGRVRHLRLLRHDSRTGFGACLRTALAETKTPLFFYTTVDYPYTPSDIRKLLDRIELRDEILHKQPDLISGSRTGLRAPELLLWATFAWKLFWRVFAGLPISESNPWLGWREFWFGHRVAWLYAIPLADANSCFKLFRTEFLKRFPIQSSGDFIHTELVAKATFLTSIMDEVPLTPRLDPIPPLGPIFADERRVFGNPQFAFPQEPILEPSPAVASSPVVEPGQSNAPSNPPQAIELMPFSPLAASVSSS